MVGVDGRRYSAEQMSNLIAAALDHVTALALRRAQAEAELRFNLAPNRRLSETRSDLLTAKRLELPNMALRSA